jgi:ABC-2 type transport system ATP-binding protein
MDYALRIRDVTKRFGAHTAVDGLSLDVPKGCIFGFLGQNGAGKTTVKSVKIATAENRIRHVRMLRLPSRRAWRAS